MRLGAPTRTYRAPLVPETDDEREFVEASGVAVVLDLNGIGLEAAKAAFRRWLESGREFPEAPDGVAETFRCLMADLDGEELSMWLAPMLDDAAMTLCRHAGLLKDKKRASRAWVLETARWLAVGRRPKGAEKGTATPK